VVTGPQHFDVTLTACCRPDVLRETLSSFRENLRGFDFAQAVLFVNVDPRPAGCDRHAVVAVCDQFFARACVNLPAEASFPRAVRWLWQRPATEYFLHLEDDWVLERPVEVADLLRVLDAGDPTLAVVNLRAYRHGGTRICLAPGLWRTDAARAIAARMVNWANPEQQLRPVMPRNPDGGKHGDYKGRQYPDDRIVIRDIGRPWLRRSGWRREGRSFTKWVSVEDAPA
jgi:hypothetical protein